MADGTCLSPPVPHRDLGMWRAIPLALLPRPGQKRGMEHPISKAATRIGTGLATLVTLTWFLWPTADWQLEPEPLGAFLIALGSWLAAEVVPVITEARSPHRHDVELLDKLHELITPNHLAFLRDQDFGGTISPEPLDAFYRLADDWRGSAYEFEDKKVRLAFEKLLATARAFTELVVTFTYRRRNFLSAKTEEDIQKGTSDVTRQRMRNMNTKATELSKEIEAFYRLARTRLQR